MLSCNHDIYVMFNDVFLYCHAVGGRERINTWCDIICVVSCELYKNSSGVYLEKNIYAQGVKKKV